ncbi:MAG: ribonuclease H-like domain-containing protein, partial [Bryobacteraceae bacterium]
PLLETRYRLARLRPPFGALDHLDLLFGARRLWRLRFESRRLADLEREVLGHEREGDIAGALIPYVYFEYLRTGRAARLAAVFRHNATDIVSLAALTGIVGRAFQNPEDCEHLKGPELAGVARWLQAAGETGRAMRLYRRAIDRGLPDDLLFRTLRDCALMAKREGRWEEARSIFADLAESRNPFQVEALEELAKHCEHAERDYRVAITHASAALRLNASESLRKRHARLERRLKKSTERRPNPGLATPPLPGT